MKHYALSNEFRSEFNFKCIDSIIPAPKSGDTVVPSFSGEEDKGQALRWLTLFTQWALQQGLSADHTLLLASTHIKYALIYYPQLSTWTEFIHDFFSYYDADEDGRFAEWYNRRATSIQITWFSYRELKTATNNFSNHKVIGDGRVGLVFKGVLHDSQRTVVVKKLKEVKADSLEDVLYEVLIHRSLSSSSPSRSSTGGTSTSRLVKLIGFSSYEQDPLLVYEYVSGGNLEEHLRGLSGERLVWDERLKIAIDVAEAITQLHYNSKLPAYHRDVKSSNILLDVHRRAKLADFGMAAAASHEKQRTFSQATQVKGSRGYIDPHYESTGKLTDVADVYSFGIVLMELVTGLAATAATGSGQHNSQHQPQLVASSLPNLVKDMMKVGKMEQLLDQSMEWDPCACEHCLRGIFGQVIKLALQCCSADPLKRPKISEVTEQLRDIQLEQKIMMMEIPREDGPYDGCKDKVRSKCSNMGMMMDKRKKNPSCRRRRY